MTYLPPEQPDTRFASIGRGVPDGVFGDAVEALIVLEFRHKLGERDVIRRCLRRQVNFVVPRYVEFVIEMPTSETGKVRKMDLTWQ